MTIKIFSIFDSKAEAYLQPFFSQTTATGIRAFASAVNDSSQPMNHHPADYYLFEIAEWDQVKGRILPNDSPPNLGCALEFVDPDASSTP